MSRYCPLTNSKTVYLNCQECDEKICEEIFYLLIAGSRSYDNYKEFSSICGHMLSQIDIPVCIVSGGAKGADSLAEKYAKEKGYQLKVFPADWNQFGKNAGPLRNRQMHDFIAKHKKRGCLCFWDGSSRGTFSNFKMARDNNTPFVVWNFVTKNYQKIGGILMNHQNYWEKKSQMKERAQRWTDYVGGYFSANIQKSIANAEIFSEDFSLKSIGKIKTEVPTEVVLLDSVSAIFAEEDLESKICVLNFASFKNPGGMFMEGSTAQEECLCHESFLYNVLSSFPDFYKENQSKKNKALYVNRALYTPDICFVRKDIMEISDVLTCAAPNFTAASKYCNVTREENRKVLESRIRFVLDIMEYKEVKIPILGAYGCGVFGQDAKEVAEVFKEAIKGHAFKKVIFAVIPGPNAEAFANVFEEAKAI